MMQQKNQEQLLLWIDMTSFMTTDLALYLDTHPYDEKAMDMFNEYNTIYQKALKEYAANFGPLCLSSAVPDKKWCWGLTKNPWERGAC